MKVFSATLSLAFFLTSFLRIGSVSSTTQSHIRRAARNKNNNDEGPHQERKLQDDELFLTHPNLNLEEMTTKTFRLIAYDDTYEVIQGNRLSVDAPGFLDNDQVVWNVGSNGGLGSGGVGMHSSMTIVYSSSSRNANFQGYLKIDKKNNGKFRYDAPDDFVGTEVFTYKACLADYPNVCDSATVTIHVITDPNRPQEVPIANDDYYTVREGQTLTINARYGFLRNDLSQSSANGVSHPLTRCSRDGNPRGDLDTHSDGSFEYKAPRCWTGEDEFTYVSCYEDFEDMESNTATVHIDVQEDRPDRPDPGDDYYEVREGETLRIDSGRYNGLLRNDRGGGDDLYIKTWSKRSGFRGTLDIDEDTGDFTYKPEPGKRGLYRFSYTLCSKDWEECVGCGDATVEIKVITNPNKPKSPPSSTNPTYRVTIGRILQGNVLDSVDNKDDRYSLVARNVRLVYGSQGVLNSRNGGSGRFDYGNAPAGTATVSFTVCYKEWPDLCSQGSITIITTGSTTGSSSSISRQGVAIYYDMNWLGATADDGGCEAAQPTVSLSCGGNGVIDFISAGIPSDNDNCQKTATGSIVCPPQNSGAVQVECRSGSGGNLDHQLIANLTSEAVSCNNQGSIGSSFMPSDTHHYGWLRTWCNGTWNDGTIGCNALMLGNPNGPDLCFSNAMTLGLSAKPADITMTSAAFTTFDEEQCVVGIGSVVPLPEPPRLEIIGDADRDPTVEGYPLKECQSDCDGDMECSGDLICFQRNGNEIVPGCIGTAVARKDYCIRPQQPSVVSRTGSP